MNNDDILKALGRFTPEQIIDAIKNTTHTSDSDSDKDKDSNNKLSEQSRALDTLIKDAFASEDNFTVASYDRQMVRTFLDEQAKGNVFCAELHKWWDGTSFSVLNDWLFTGDMSLSLELLNKDGERKFLKLKVAL